MQVSLRWQVEKLVHSSETLLQTVSSLRVAAVANNIPALNRRIDARTKELKDAEVRHTLKFSHISLVVICFRYVVLLPAILPHQQYAIAYI